MHEKRRQINKGSWGAEEESTKSLGLIREYKNSKEKERERIRRKFTKAKMNEVLDNATIFSDNVKRRGPID